MVWRKKLNEYIINVPLKTPQGKCLAKKYKLTTLGFIRYADDFVVLHENLEIVKKCQSILEQWLWEEVGLKLKTSKTRISHTFVGHNGEKPGFNFLGFNIRQYKAGKRKTAKNPVKQLLGFRTLIGPSKENIKRHYQEIAQIIDRYKSAKQINLINKLNPIIRGWANYYSTENSSKVYHLMDYLIWRKLRRWAKRRHPNKPGKYWAHKYWHTVGGDNWVFSSRERDKQLNLIKYGQKKIIAHIKIKGGKSPYDGDTVYWGKRLREHPELCNREQVLLKKQHGVCNKCKIPFQNKKEWQVDHIIPRANGGKDTYNNLQLLHKHCHLEKTRKDLSIIQKKKRGQRF